MEFVIVPFNLIIMNKSEMQYHPEGLSTKEFNIVIHSNGECTTLKVCPLDSIYSILNKIKETSCSCLSSNPYLNSTAINTLCFIYQNSVISSALSFAFYGISEGAHIYVFQPKPKQQQQQQQQQQLNTNSNNKLTYMKKNGNHISDKIERGDTNDCFLSINNINNKNNEKVDNNNNNNGNNNVIKCGKFVCPKIMIKNKFRELFEKKHGSNYDEERLEESFRAFENPQFAFEAAKLKDRLFQQIEGTIKCHRKMIKNFLHKTEKCLYNNNELTNQQDTSSNDKKKNAG